MRSNLPALFAQLQARIRTLPTVLGGEAVDKVLDNFERQG
jgi:hypothetical protein